MLVGEVVAVPRASPRAATSLSTAGGFFCPHAECTELPAEAEGGFGTREGGREGGRGEAAGPSARSKRGEQTLKN